MRSRSRPANGAVLVAAALLTVTASGATAPAPDRSVSSADADAILRRPPQLEPRAARLLRSVGTAYARLKSLESISRDGLLRSTARMKRDRRLLIRQEVNGKLQAVAYCDGRRYLEYAAPRNNYRDRDAALLGKLALPANVRPFFQSAPGLVMIGFDGKPAVREYAFRHAGTQKLGDRRAEVLRVSTLVRAGGGWRSYESIRYYDAETHLLTRMVNGTRTVDIRNRPGAALSESDIAWRPPTGATKSFD